MDRVLKVRQPPEQSQVALSRASKIFFGCDIFQVIAVVVFQSSMIALGDFSAYNNVEHPGMGPGRRIYMTIYMGAVVYTCFLCLFAVKRQNFMEIVAFDLQNFGFVTYSFIQLYHVGFKTYNGLKTSENDALPKIVIANATTLLLLSIVFTYLSYKLNMEFGWKIYKRVRFNIKLRGIYQVYELLSCLLKIEVLYWGMFAIVHSLVLLRDTHNMLFFLSLAFIPLSFLYAGLGYYATRLENKWLMTFFLSWTVAGIGYFLYKLYGFITRTCSGCKEFEKNGKDIPSEAFMHFVYLVVINLLVAITIFGVALKAFLNFGGGLAEHFNRKKKPQLKLPGRYDLSLGQGSHSYPEESVISVTSYEYDEFGESVTLERSLLHPTVAALLSDNGQHLEDKRSCSLPNLLIETPERSSTFGGLGQASAPVLSGWLEAQDRKQNSAPCEVTSVSQEKPNGKCTRDTNSMEEKQVCDDKIHLEGIANADGAPFSPCTITAKSPGLGDATHNCPLNGYVNKKSDHSEGNFYREVPLASELKLNGHLVGKARLKCTPETEVEKSCLLQGVNSTKCSCGDDEQCSEQFASRGMCHGNPLLLQNQRPAQLNGASTSDDEVFDRYT